MTHESNQGVKKYTRNLGVIGLSHGLVVYLAWFFIWPHGVQKDPWNEFIVWSVACAAVFLFWLRAGLFRYMNRPLKPGFIEGLRVDRTLGLSLFFVVGSALFIAWLHLWLWPRIQVEIVVISYRLFGIAPFVDL